MSDTPEQPTITRRGLVDWVIYVCSAIFGAALVLPAVAYLLPVTKSGPVKSREEVGDASGWGAWTAKKVSVAGKPVLVIRTDKGYLAFSAVCPHLGCLVEFAEVERNIICPCHAATFNLEGQVTGGPPPRPLAAYTVSEVQGKIYVSL